MRRIHQFIQIHVLNAFLSKCNMHLLADKMILLRYVEVEYGYEPMEVEFAAKQDAPLEPPLVGLILQRSAYLQSIVTERNDLLKKEIHLLTVSWRLP